MTLRRTHPRRRILRVAAALATATLGAAAIIGPAAPATALAAPGSAAHQPLLTDTSVTVSVLDLTPTTPPATAAKTPLTVTLALTNTTDQSLTNVRVEGSRGNPISSRPALDTAIATVAAPDPSLIDPIATPSPVTATIGPRSTTQVVFATTTSTDSGSGPGICICENRIYPLYFAVHAQDSSGADIVVGSGQTFITGFGLAAPSPTQVAWLWPIVDPPHRVLEDTVFTDDALAYSVDGGRLDRVLAVVEYVATNHLAMTLLVDPDLIDELAVMAAGHYTVQQGNKTVAGTGTAAAGRWLARLRGALAADAGLDLNFTAPGDPDVDALSRAGLTWSTGLSQAAQTRITAALGLSALNQSVAWPADGVAGRSTLDVLGRLGVRTAVLDDSTVPLTGAESANRLTVLPTAAGPITAEITQPSIQRFVGAAITVGSSAGPTQLPQLVSEVSIGAVGDAAAQHFVVITPAREVNPVPELAEAAISDTAAAGWAQSVTLAQAAASVDPVEHADLPAPPASGALPAASLAVAQRVASVVPALTTMMPATDAAALLGPLPTAVQRAESSAWRQHPGAGAAFAQTVQRRVNDLESGVRIIQPTTGSYTLASSNSPLPITVENDLAVPVTVQIAVGAVNGVPGFAAMTLPGQLIAPNTKLTLHIPTTVQRTGRFRVQAVLLTPSGAQLGAPVYLSVRSTALGTVGVVITIAAAVVLILALLVRLFRRVRLRTSAPPPAPVVAG